MFISMDQLYMTTMWYWSG